MDVELSVEYRSYNWMEWIKGMPLALVAQSSGFGCEKARRMTPSEDPKASLDTGRRTLLNFSSTLFNMNLVDSNGMIRHVRWTFPVSCSREVTQLIRPIQANMVDEQNVSQKRES